MLLPQSLAAREMHSFRGNQDLVVVGESPLREGRREEELSSRTVRESTSRGRSLPI